MPVVISETRVMLKEIWLGFVFSMCKNLSILQNLKNIIEILDKHKKFISLKYPQDIHLVEILQWNNINANLSSQWILIMTVNFRVKKLTIIFAQKLLGPNEVCPPKNVADPEKRLSMHGLNNVLLCLGVVLSDLFFMLGSPCSLPLDSLFDQ